MGESEQLQAWTDSLDLAKEEREGQGTATAYTPQSPACPSSEERFRRKTRVQNPPRALAVGPRPGAFISPGLSSLVYKMGIILWRVVLRMKKITTHIKIVAQINLTAPLPG